MNTYAEKLRNEEWRIKRHKILVRDLFQCQNCYNEKILYKCEIGRAFIEDCFANIYMQNHGWIASFFVSKTINTLVPKSSKVYFDISENSMPQIRAFLDEEDRFIYVPALHVHHKYYSENTEPWEYPDNALITYCWICHELLHSEINIPKFSKEGFEIGTMYLALDAMELESFLSFATYSQVYVSDVKELDMRS